MQQDGSQRPQHRRRIVAGVDGSPGSRNALRWAVDLARPTATIVEAVIAWQSQPVYDYGYGWTPIALGDEVAAAAAERVLRQSVAEVLGDDRCAVQIRLRVLQGRPADVLLSVARFADMLILGSRGHRGVAGIQWNSVSRHCVRHASCPVLVIPATPAVPPLGIVPQSGLRTGEWSIADRRQDGGRSSTGGRPGRAGRARGRWWSV